MANVKATDLIEYTRASTGAYLDSDGILKTAANNIPRIEYDADGNLLGLLVEEARTNLITYSTPDSNWTPSRVTITENNAVSPDGTENATRINETTATGSHYISGNAANVTSGLNYTLSVYVKADTSTACQLLFSSTGFGSSQYANFDLSTGTVGYEAANATATIQDAGNGWYRCAITSTATATTSSIVGFVVFVNNNASSSTRILPYTGNTAHQMYVYGAQVEAGSFPTSHIKTTGSTASRSADVASIDVDQFGYNQSEGTVVAEYLPTKVDATIRAVFELVKDTNDKLYSASATIRHWFVKSGNTVQANLDLGSSTEDQSNKIAGAYKLNDFAASLDGASVNTDTSGSVPTGITDLHIGGIKDSSSSYLNGHIKSIKYFPKRLSNAKLQELTS